MRPGAGRKLAGGAFLIAIFLSGASALTLMRGRDAPPDRDAMDQDLTDQDLAGQGWMILPLPDAPVEPDVAQSEARSNLVGELVEASRVLGEMQETIGLKSTELRELEALIATRQEELDALEAALVEKGLELDLIVEAVRDQNYAILATLDWQINRPGRAVDGQTDTGSKNEVFGPDQELDRDMEKIRNIIYAARKQAEADPAAPLDLAAPARDAGAGSVDASLVQIMFESGSSELTVGGLTRTLAAAEVYSDTTTHQIRITAYTDTVGSAEANARLSQARAETVARVLTEAGIHPQAIEIVAMGEDLDNLPIATGDGVSEPLNRCVEIVPVTLVN